MKINQSLGTEATDELGIVVISPPNDNTDGRDCVCGHAENSHRQVEDGDGEPSWRCGFCTCTRAPVHV